MPIATPEVYAEMLDKAKQNRFAYPAINVSSSQTLIAAIRGFAEAGSDGIVQVSTGGAEYLSGSTVKNMVTGSVALAAYAHEVAKNFPVNIALHTDHCPKDKLDGFVRPLLEISAERVARGENPLFQSHMWDGSAVPLTENLEIAKDLLAKTAAAKIVLEIEVGVVGGEEDGVANEINEKLYTTVEDGLATVEALGTGENGRYITALTFGNVHGVYKPGAVKLRPEILKEIQDQVGAKVGKERPFDLVFHGGSGSTLEEIRAAVDYGVIKMNVDTDTQYAFTRPAAGHMFSNYDGVLKVDGEVGNKKAYDPRAWGKAGRGRHGRARRRGLREPPLHGYVAERLTSVPPDRAGVFEGLTAARGGPLTHIRARARSKCLMPVRRDARVKVARTRSTTRAGRRGRPRRSSSVRADAVRPDRGSADRPRSAPRRPARIRRTRRGNAARTPARCARRGTTGIAISGRSAPRIRVRGRDRRRRRQAGVGEDEAEAGLGDRGRLRAGAARSPRSRVRCRGRRPRVSASVW